jgi:signal transduction histidine kinase
MPTYLKIKNFLIVFVTIFIAGFSNSLSASNIINFEDELEIMNISSSLLIFEDKSHNLSLKEVITKEFSPTKSSVPNFGVSKSVFWIKIAINNTSKQKDLILDLSTPTLDKVEFYYPDSINHYRSILMGENLPFNKRKYKDPHYLMDVSIPIEKTYTYYLKISSNDGIQLPMKLGTKNVIYNQIKNRDILSGIYFGIMLVMIFYNLFVFFSVRDTSYLYYVVYILFVLLTQTILQGYPFQYLWNNSPNFAQYSIFLFPSLVGIAGMVFMNVFLKVKSYINTFYKISFLLSAIYIIPLIAPFFGWYKLGYQILNINAGIVSVFILVTSIIVLRKGYQPAKYFLVAWTIFLVGVFIFILTDVGVLPYNNFTRYTMQIGSAIETILLSFALAARINVYKREKEESQLKTMEVLKENEKIIREQNIVLEHKVEERTSELNKTLSNLKLTQSKLVDAEKMSSLGQLTAGIAHEINNPINFVSSNIKPLREDIVDINTIMNKYEELLTTVNIKEKLNEIEQLKKELDFEYLKTELNTIVDGIEDGASRTKEIVSGLRNFSRLDEDELKEANINHGLDSTLILIKNKLKGIRVNRGFEDIPNIECYPGKLNQLFMNVIDNAISAIHKKDMDNSQGEITIKTSADEKYLSISVKDNGIGIDNKKIDKIFEPFFTTNDVGEGTGLGLSIAHTIVEAHNGEIGVKSEKNRGTEMVIKIPIKQ